MLIAGFPAGAFQANCYVLAAGPGEPCVVIDPGQDAIAGLRRLVAEHTLVPSAVLLTHGHLDHVADAAAFCRDADIPAYLHSTDEHLLDDPLSGLSPELRAMLAGYPLDGLRPPEVIGFDEQLTVAGLDLAIDHAPGHTGGSVVLRLAGDGERPEVLFTGDTLFAGSVGRTDLPGGSRQQLAQSLRTRLLTRADDAVILPGHGPTSTIGAERSGNPHLAGLR